MKWNGKKAKWGKCEWKWIFVGLFVYSPRSARCGRKVNGSDLVTIDAQRCWVCGHHIGRNVWANPFELWTCFIPNTSWCFQSAPDSNFEFIFWLTCVVWRSIWCCSQSQLMWNVNTFSISARKSYTKMISILSRYFISVRWCEGCFCAFRCRQNDKNAYTLKMIEFQFCPYLPPPLLCPRSIFFSFSEMMKNKTKQINSLTGSFIFSFLSFQFTVVFFLSSLFISCAAWMGTYLPILMTEKGRVYY